MNWMEELDRYNPWCDEVLVRRALERVPRFEQQEHPTRRATDTTPTHGLAATVVDGKMTCVSLTDKPRDPYCGVWPEVTL